MTMTLGEALTANDYRDIDIKDRSIDVGFDNAKIELDREGKKFDRKTLNGALKKAILTTLDVALDEIIGQAWSTLKDIRKYADPSQTPPDDVNIVPLSNHSIESAQEPSVDLIVHGVTVHSFPFSVSVSLNVEGANLVVQRGMIQEIRLAKLELGGSVKLHDHTLLEKRLGQVTVPGVMRLANPIPILSSSA